MVDIKKNDSGILFSDFNTSQKSSNYYGFISLINNKLYNTNAINISVINCVVPQINSSKLLKDYYYYI